MDLITGWMFNNLVLTGAGAVAIVFIIARMLPNEKLEAIGYKLGHALSLWGRLKLGKNFWEKIEDFIENTASAFFRGFAKGLSADDTNGNGKEK